MDIISLETATLELEKLQVDLQTAEYNLKESAEKGLALLEAKSDLEERYEILENELEKVRVERDTLREALEKRHTLRKEYAEIEIEHENDLFEEKVLAEESFAVRIQGLEAENRNLKADFDRSSTEVKKFQEWIKALGDDNESLRRNHEKLHKELLEHRLTEKIMSNENEELHGDNVRLRKHVALLESRTKEFEGLKFEARKLSEDKELLQSELDEAHRLTEIVKQQAEEAWKTLENERELRRGLQRQLHDQSEERERWNRMATLRLEIDEDGEFYDESSVVPQMPPQQDNLFAELQRSSVEQDSQLSSEVESYKQRVAQIFRIVTALETLASGSMVTDLKNSIIPAAQEIRGLCQNVGSLEHSAFLDDMHSQMNKRNNRQTVMEGKISRLSAAVESLCEMLMEKQLCLNTCYESLRVLRGMVNNGASNVNYEPTGPSQDGSSASQQGCGKKHAKLEEEIRARLNTSDVALPDFANIDITADADTVISTVDDLKRMWQDVIGSSANRSRETGEESAVDLQDQIDRLKAHLGRKRDEVNLLKEALNNAQSTAEKAMVSLKAKYEHEKESSTKTLAQLRKELNHRKEDAATFASIRSMLNARCDDYCTQLENLQRQLKSAEEEKRTLNSLLRMAIHQKLDLIHRVEGLENTLDGQQIRSQRRDTRPTRSIFRGRTRTNDQQRYGS